jgi:hypothetical protein
MPMRDVVSPERIAEALTEHWSPRVIADLDDCFVKVAKVHGSLAWHSHRVERKTTSHTGSEVTDKTRSIAEQLRPVA